MISRIQWKFIYILSLLSHSTAVPVIDNQPLVFNLFEGTVTQTEIGCVSCTPTTPSNPYDMKILSVSPTVPCGQKCFGLWNTAIPLAPENYCIYFIPTSRLSFIAASVYNINVQCRDDVAMVNALVEIRINPNTPPYFTTLFETGAIQNTKTYVLGDSIFLANAKDIDIAGPSGDVLVYSMSAVPNEGLFSIGEGDGQIRVTRDMKEVCSVSPTELLVSVRDNANTVAGPKRISLTFQDVSVAPTVNNIDKVINVNELEVVLATLIIFSPSIPSVTYNLIPTPLFYTEHFTMVGNALTLSKPVNFEDASFINITVEVQDGYCTGINWIGLNIINQNDPPVLFVNQQVFVVDEGLVRVDPGFVTTDEDSGQNQIFTFIVPNSQFSISPISGVISSLGIQDLDKPGVNAIEYMLDVQVSDGFAVATTQIQITVKETNDNSPIILSASSYSYSRMDCDKTQKLGTILGFDKDTGINGEFEFTGGSSGPLTVTADGMIYMSSLPSTGGYFIEVRAVDHGINPRTSIIPATVSLVVLSCPQPTTISSPITTPLAVFTGETTPILPLPTNQIDFFTDLENIPWLVLAGTLALILLALVLFVIHRLCCAKRLPPFRKPPQTPPYDQRDYQRRPQHREPPQRSHNDNRKDEKNKSTNKKKLNNNVNFSDPQPPGPNGYPSPGLNNELPPAQPRQPDDVRTMSPFKLDNKSVAENYKPRTDLNSYEFWREASDGGISSRHIKVSPKH